MTRHPNSSAACQPWYRVEALRKRVGRSGASTSARQRALFAICYFLGLLALSVLSVTLVLEQIDFAWNHEAHGSFIRAERADVSLLFDSCARCWTLRIYKRQTTFGHPVTFEIAFKERYSPTLEQTIALVNNILVVELQ
jgi:hypothetical protein